MSRVIRIAIIGGIGSGKSEVSKLVCNLGGYVLIADEINSELLKSKDYIAKINDIIPEAVIGGVVNREKLADIVFFDETKRELLINIAHPEIERVMREREREGIVFYEIPLIDKCGIKFDHYWYIYSDEDIRIERVAKRNGITRQRVEKVMSLQGTIKVPENAVVINNNGDFTELCVAVEELYCALQKSLVSL